MSKPVCQKCGETYLSDRQVASRFGVSRSAVWEWSKRLEGFPQPFNLSSGTTRWRLSEVTLFEKNLERLHRPKGRAIEAGRGQ